MKVLFAHKNILPVKKYGGTERIIFWLMKELIRQGHEVTLIGHPQSQVAGTGIQLIPLSSEKQQDFRSVIPKSTDVIHLFYAPSFPLDYPFVVTIEGNGKAGEQFPLNTVFVSHHHAQRHGGQQFVYNGLDLEEYPFSPRRQQSWEHFLFLAKASWKVKNLSGCLTACKQNKKHLHIAGGRAWTFSPFIHSYGMVDQRKKMALLQKTDALLFPVRWPEPFGIAMIEAYSQGLPVIGSAYGSLPEVIAPETGVICQNYAEFERAVQNPQRNFDPQTIRAFVENKFSIQKMTKDYLNLYQKVIRGENLNTNSPCFIGDLAAEELLPF